MLTNAYSIKDSATATFSPPFFQPNDAVAIRSFTDLARDPSTNIFRHPSDFTLHRIGTWNDDTGLLEASEHEQIKRASDCHASDGT